MSSKKKDKHDKKDKADKEKKSKDKKDKKKGHESVPSTSSTGSGQRAWKQKADFIRNNTSTEYASASGTSNTSPRASNSSHKTSPGRSTAPQSAHVKTNSGPTNTIASRMAMFEKNAGETKSTATTSRPASAKVAVPPTRQASSPARSTTVVATKANASPRTGNASFRNSNTSTPTTPASPSNSRVSALAGSTSGRRGSAESAVYRQSTSILRPDNRPASAIEGVMRPQRPSDVRGTRVTLAAPKAVALEKSSVTAGPELDKRRAMIVRELFDTEKTYVIALTNLVQNFKKPWYEFATGRKDVSMLMMDKIFSNVETIVPINENLLKEFEAKLKAWNNRTQIGDVFLKFAPFLKLYSTYSSNYDIALDALDQLSKESWFEQLCSNRHALESLLINPIQRIPRYIMLLEDLWRHTLTTHPDNKALEDSIKLCKDVAMHVNSAIATTRHSEQLTMMGLGHLLEAHRKLVKFGNMTITMIRHYDGSSKQKKVKKDFKFILFNDLLVFMKERKEMRTDNVSKASKDGTLNKKSGLKIKQIWNPKTDMAWPLELIWLADVDANMFELIGPMMTLTVDGGKDKGAWYKALKENIEVILLAQNPNASANPAEKLLDREGRYTYGTGEVYEGWWNLGRMQGKGVWSFLGSFYEGEFNLNLKEGTGILEYADGQVYTGAFQNGKPHGKGKSVTTGGDVYEGDWERGLRHGKGTLIYRNGDKFVGSFKENHIEGEGLLMLGSVGTTYEGQFIGGRYHGIGVLTTFEGVFKGAFEHGRQTGSGRMEYKSGVVYEGSWKNGLWVGPGRLETPEGTFDGVFKAGFLDGKGKVEYRDGSTYEGAFQTGRRHGKGTYTNPKGYITQYTGDWAYDTREGSGEFVFANGDRFVGPVSGGMPDGYGKLFLVNGMVIEGKWADGILESKSTITDDQGDIVSLDAQGQVDGQREGLEYLIPPICPIFQYQ